MGLIGFSELLGLWFKLSKLLGTEVNQKYWRTQDLKIYYQGESCEKVKSLLTLMPEEGLEAIPLVSVVLETRYFP